MEDLELFNLVKTNLRVLGTSFDEAEIEPLILTAQEDIEASTGKPFDIDNRMECLAVVTFVKAHFGSGDTQDRYLQRYDMMLRKIGVQRMGHD